MFMIGDIVRPNDEGRKFYPWLYVGRIVGLDDANNATVRVIGTDYANAELMMDILITLRDDFIELHPSYNKRFCLTFSVDAIGSHDVSAELTSNIYDKDPVDWDEDECGRHHADMNNHDQLLDAFASLFDKYDDYIADMARGRDDKPWAPAKEVVRGFVVTKCPKDSKYFTVGKLYTILNGATFRDDMGKLHLIPPDVEDKHVTTVETLAGFFGAWNCLHSVFPESRVEYVPVKEG